MIYYQQTPTAVYPLSKRARKCGLAARAALKKFVDPKALAAQKISEKFVLSTSDMTSNGFVVSLGNGEYGFHHDDWPLDKSTPRQPGEFPCARCSQIFLPFDREQPPICRYHPDRFDWKSNGYPCCGLPKFGEGCTTGSRHVWNGLRSGWNGPFSAKSGYVETRAPILPRNWINIFALDCEMCYTANGMEATKVSVVDIHGDLVYESLIEPIFPIIDYNTRYSGITAEMLDAPNVPNLKQVQRDLVSFIDADAIVVGHALHNDLRALKLVHERVVDTSIVYSHPKGLPFRYSLKSIMKRVLNKDVQTDFDGHCSQADSRHCLEALLHAVAEKTD